MGRQTKKIAEIVGKVVLLLVMAFAAVMAVMLVIGVVVALQHVRSGGSVGDGGINLSPGRWSTFVQPVCFIAAPLLMYLSFERKRGWSMGVKQPLPLACRRLGEGMGWGVLLITISFAGIGAAGGYRLIDAGVRAGEGGGLAVWFLLFIFVAINEELMTRGYVQGLIRYHYGPWPAVAVTSLLFASLHLGNDDILQNPVPLLELFAAGVLLGVSREVSGGLWMPIGLHLTWNFFQGNVYGFAVSGKPVESFIRLEARGAEWLSGGGFGAEGSLITLLVTAAGTWMVYRWYSRRTVGRNMGQERGFY
ncbi:lysostaphin resistance A-like protein [Gorillibacterium sp. sgz5001074]|uniref:CPBP family intramembrane glutamic endopeptidase n=1 Tax=Gorillibacterium sp. sgz5001074 TaxID=3446695 RepID=UPI003F67319B